MFDISKSSVYTLESGEAYKLETNNQIMYGIFHLKNHDVIICIPYWRQAHLNFYVSASAFA